MCNFRNNNAEGCEFTSLVELLAVLILSYTKRPAVKAAPLMMKSCARQEQLSV